MRASGLKGFGCLWLQGLGVLRIEDVLGFQGLGL